MIPLVIGISVLSYAIIVLAPGDPAKLLADPEKMTAESYVAMRAELGLDDPGPVRYAKTMASLFTGDLRSFRTQQRVRRCDRRAPADVPGAGHPGDRVWAGARHAHRCHSGHQAL